MMYDNLIFVERFNHSYYPIYKRQVCDYVIKALDNIINCERPKKSYSDHEKELLELLKDDKKRKDIIDLYQNNYLSSGNPNSLSNAISYGNNFSSRNHQTEAQIIEDYIRQSVKFNIEAEELLIKVNSVDDFIEYNYKKEICAILLLEQFKNYTQKLTSIAIVNSNINLILTLLSLDIDTYKFEITLKMDIEDSDMQEKDLILNLNKRYGRNLFREFSVIDLKFKDSITLGPIE